MVVLMAIGTLLFSGCSLTTPGTDGELSAVVTIIDAPESMWAQDVNWWQTKDAVTKDLSCPLCHEVTLIAEPDSTGTVSHFGWHSICSDNKYARGTIITITATANPGYEFDNWTTSSSGVSGISKNDAITTFYMPCNDVTITAHFIEECTKYSLTIDVIPIGAGSTTGAGNYCQGAEINLLATPTTGYEFDFWTTNYGSINGDGYPDATFVMPDKATVITAHFKQTSEDYCDTPDVDVDVNVDLPIWNSEFDKYVYVYFNIENTGADIQEYTVTFTAYGVTPGIGTPIKSTDYTTYTGSATGVNLAAGEDRDSFAQIDVANDKVVFVELASLELQ